MTQRFGSDEQFLEDWLQFGPFHRTRTGLSQLPALVSNDDGVAASAMTTILQEWLFSFEDFGIWADVLKRYSQDQTTSLIDCMDKADLAWGPFFNQLLNEDHNEYASLFSLPSPGSIQSESGRDEYIAALIAYAQMAAAAARNMESATQMGKRWLYRLLNKIKHGLLLTPARLSHNNQLVVVFYPEAGAPPPQDLWMQEVSTRAGEFFVRETFAFGRLTAATLDTYFRFRFQRPPEVPWMNHLTQPSVERSIENIEATASLPDAATLVLSPQTRDTSA